MLFLNAYTLMKFPKDPSDSGAEQWKIYKRAHAYQFDPLKWSEGSNKMIYGGHIGLEKFVV